MIIMNNDAGGNKDAFEMKYAAAVQTIKEAIQRSQARALHVVNRRTKQAQSQVYLSFALQGGGRRSQLYTECRRLSAGIMNRRTK